MLASLEIFFWNIGSICSAAGVPCSPSDRLRLLPSPLLQNCAVSGKTTFNVLKDRITVNNEKVNYSDKNHRLHWLNILIGDVKNQITGIYHGVCKRDLPLFLKEQEYRINHRYAGTELMTKVQKYIKQSTSKESNHKITGPGTGIFHS